MNIEEISLEEIEKINVKEIALNDRFSKELKFVESEKYLRKVKEILEEINNYKEVNEIPEEEYAKVLNYFKQLKNKLIQIQNFNTLEGNPGQQHASIEQGSKDFYQQAFNDLKSIVSFLRTSQPDFEKYNEQIRHIEELKKKILDIEEYGKSSATSSSDLGSYFYEEYKEHLDAAKNWLRTRWWFFGFLLAAIVVKLLYLIKVKDYIFERDLPIFIAVTLILYSGLSFASKNYYIHSDLAVNNKHRDNVSKTMFEYLKDAKRDEDTKLSMIKHGVETLFKHLPNGYTKNQEQSSDPMDVIVKGISDRTK